MSKKNGKISSNNVDLVKLMGVGQKLNQKLMVIWKLVGNDEKILYIFLVVMELS